MSRNAGPSAPRNAGPSAPRKGGASRAAAPRTAVPQVRSADFLPVSAQGMRQRGWDQVDFVYVSGDAYVDHPSFGTAIITRVLERHGYRVGIIAQPDWKDPASVQVFGRPRLGFLVSSGNMDSMVNHYTSTKLPRSSDAYSPGGKTGMRPNHATVVYANLVRRVYKDCPIIVGGIEASLRRLAHYDYWSDKLKRSILLDSGADLVSYGMGERSIVEIADALAAGIPVDQITYVRGTVYKARSLEGLEDAIVLPSFEQMQQDKTLYAQSFGVQYKNSDPVTARCLVEEYPHQVFAVQNPPAEPLTTAEMDAVYRLPYARTYHPMYEALGGVPAIKEVKFSLTSSRGCFGECAFCALTFHQGRQVSSRSKESLVEEAKLLIADPEFKGYIHDVGGPTANFRKPACQDQLRRGACANRRCLTPKPCPKLDADHTDYLEVLRAIRSLPGVKKVFIRSGVRFDYLMADPDGQFLRELCEHHVSGQLKVAPEHVSDTVLSVMGKPPHRVYEQFGEAYRQVNQELAKKQYLVPYLMSSHPGSGLAEAVELAEYVRDMGYMPEQVADFYPTPSTASTVMYYTGLDPRTLKPVYVPRSTREKAMQRALIQYRDPKNHDLVVEALRVAHREDLIGYGPKCLVRPGKGGACAKSTKGASSRKPRNGSQGNPRGNAQGNPRGSAHSNQQGTSRRNSRNPRA